MLTSSTEFMKSFLWKYIDITINKSEMELLRTKYTQNLVIKSMFERFKDIFYDEIDIDNFVFIISIIEPCYWDNFMIFYITCAIKFEMTEKYKINTVEDLDKYIDTNERKFKLLLICLYYYF
jgi:hypothetical protein